MDGTILDSMPMWVNIEKDYLISMGLTPSPDTINALRSLNQAEAARFFRTEYGITQSYEEMAAGKSRIIEDFYFNHSQLKESVLPVLDAFQTLGIKMCVATATDRYLTERALRRCGVFGYFGRIFTCAEEGTNKSAPEIFLRAAAFLGTDVGDTLVVEDALYAVRTAKSAGFPVAAIYDSAADKQQDAIKELCDFYLTSMADMLKLL